MIGLNFRTLTAAAPIGAAGILCGARSILWVGALLVSASGFLSSASAADILERGDSIVTGFSGVKAADDIPTDGDPFDGDFIDIDGRSMQIRRFDPDSPPAGQLIDAPIVFSVKAGDVGQVFAIALDEGNEFDPLTSTPNIYLGATSAFGIQIVRPDSDGDGQTERLKRGDPKAEWMEGQFGPDGGPGSIWKVDGKTGAVSHFATIPGNTGAGIGDIAFDKATRQFFASDLDTGLIHRLSADGTVIDSFDHGELGPPAIGLPAVPDDGEFMNIKDIAFDALNSETWGLAPPERMVWGISMYGGRLYYAVADGPEVWSVGINLDGTFANDPRREIDVVGTPGRFPISDIAFDSKGYMYVAQRGGIQGSYTYTKFTQPKESVVFRFKREVPDDPETPGIWVPIPEEYAIGFPSDYHNTSGGIALGYGYDQDNSGKTTRGACDLMVWSTGDALRNDAGLVAQLADGGAPIVHGLQGNDRKLIRPENEPPTAAYFVDYDGEFEDRRKTGHVGDVEIWQPCDKAADYGNYTPLPEPPPEITTPGEFNLRVEKKAIGPCVAGGLGFLCDYIVRVTNTGPDPYAGPVVIKDQLPTGPAGAVMTFSPQPPWLCLEILPNEHQCTFDPAVLWPGDSVDLFVNVNLPAAYPLCYLDNAAGLVWPLGRGDSNPADDFDVGTALIPAANCPPAAGDTTNLKIEKFPWTPFCQEDPASYVCHYFVIVRNTGPGVYSDTINVAESVPDGTTATFAPQPPWNCSGAGPDYTCEHEPVVLNPFEGVVLGATVTVPKPLAAGLACSVTNKASIEYSPGGSDQNTDPGDDEAEGTALIPALCPALPIWNNLALEKSGPEDRCPVVGANWECDFTLRVTTGAQPYTSEIALYDVLPFGTPAGATIDFQPPADWTCGSLLFLPNAYGCSSTNPNLAAGASVEIPMTVKVPVGPATSCGVNNNAQIFKAPPGSLLNVFGGDDTASASAEFQTVVNGDGTMFCAWPASAGPQPPITDPEPEEKPTACPKGWTPTPVPGKCCPHKTYWNGARCTRDIKPPPPPPPPSPPKCWSGWFEINAGDAKSYVRRGYKVRRHRSGKQSIWCARNGPPPACKPGWTTTPVRGKCCPPGRPWDAKRNRCWRPTPPACKPGWTSTPIPGICCPPDKPWNKKRLRCGGPPTPGCKPGWTPTPIPGECCPPGKPWDSKNQCCEGDVPPPTCKPGWTRTPIRGKCCPPGKPWDSKRKRCGQRVICPLGWTTTPYRGKCCPPGERWNAKRKRCVKPSSAKERCLQKGWKWTGNRCVDPNRRCPKGFVGKPPNCKKKEPRKCPKGFVGKPPNCKKKEPRKCPKGFVGKPPNCKKKQPRKCPKGFVGKPPNCKKKQPRKCPKGFVGKPPNCKKKQPRKCPKGFVGKPPNCKKKQSAKCPKGFKGRPPNCRLKKSNLNRRIRNTNKNKMSKLFSIK